MATTEVRFQLKKPLLVYGLATCFMLAPLGNLIMSMINYGVPHWYYPSVMLSFFGSVTWADKIWLLLTFSAGAALMVQRKTFWFLGMSVLLIAGLFNLKNGLFGEEALRGGGPSLMTGFLLLSNFGVVGLLYHFRFPYLDRRESWWGVHPRYACHLTVKGEGFSGKCVNVSMTGAFLEIPDHSFELGQEIHFTLGEMSYIKAEVVRKSPNGYGVQFALDSIQRDHLRFLINELKLPLIGEKLAA